MTPARFSRLVFAAGAALLAALSLPGQMQPYARLEGQLVPVVGCRFDHLIVLQDGEKRTDWDMTVQIRAGTTFADGLVEVKDVQADLNPLRDASAADRAKPDAIRFRYKAQLIADRSLPECYALVSFLAEGSVGTQLIPVGRLSAGEPKAIELKLLSHVDSVCSLHVFSNGLEVRSTQHREPYDVMAYYATFLKETHGLPAAELLKSVEFYEHRLSPDGRQLAALRLRDAKKILIVYDLEVMKLVCETPVADSDRLARDLTWVSDHEVAYVAEEAEDGRWIGYKLYLLDVSTGKTRALAKDVSRIIESLQDKPEVLLISHRWWTEKYNIRTEKRFDLQELEGGRFIFDRNGNDRVLLRNEGDKQMYFCRPTPGARMRPIDDIVKQPGLRFDRSAAQTLDRIVDVHSVGPDGDTLYVSTRLGGSDRFELAAFSMSEGVIKKTIAKHPRFDLTTSDYGTARLLFARDSAQLLGMVYAGQKPQVVWLDPRCAAVQKSMDATFPDHVNLPIDWSRDRGTFVFFSTSDQAPGTFYVFKPQESKLIPLLELGERLKGRAMARTEAFEFSARDGQKIPAYLTRPTTLAPGPAPLIVSIHGGPMARDGWKFDAENQFFASRGYLVLQVNYRGSSGYGAAFQNAGLRARLDTVVLDDIADGTRYLIEQKMADPARVAVMGASFGGWATYMSLIKYPELYRAGIAVSAVSNWRKFIRDDHWRFENMVAYSFWKSLLGRENFEAEEKFIDPVGRAAEIRQPLFIIHGEQDEVVSAEEAKMMLEAVKKHNPNIQSHSFPYASHSHWPFEDRVVMLNEMARFLENFLGKPAGDSPTGTAH